MRFRHDSFLVLLILLPMLPACGQTITHMQNTSLRVGSPPTIFPSSAPVTLEGQLMPMHRIEKPISLDDQLAAMRSAILSATA